MEGVAADSQIYEYPLVAYTGMTTQEFAAKLNAWGSENKPFLFVADFELQSPLAIALDEIDPAEICYFIDGITNVPDARRTGTPAIIGAKPISFDEYLTKFSVVYRHLHYGDSYLANLTAKTEVELSHSLRDLFDLSRARYKLWIRDKFLVFSPESFVQIEDGKIYSFPMKGTIDASVPDASNRILADEKELAEHVTIVDLIRNDLSLVADNVKVERFRYIDEVPTTRGGLLQVSSAISGDLPADHRHTIGDILLKLLPAGSVSGAPKRKTVDVLREAENEERGYYTGVFGYFDGSRLNSGVMIRFIEHAGGRYYYRSGGGITAQSTAQSEYQEMINKIYVPVD